MWTTGNKPPPLPPSSSTANSSQRKNSVDAELDALRNRGTGRVSYDPAPPRPNKNPHTKELDALRGRGLAARASFDRSTHHPTKNPRAAELEALERRGFTTLLNRHFEEATQKVAAEKAAADAALRDLESRKAATREFVPSGDGALSPLDTLYLSVHKWRKECRRKERETLLLYQRYVNKFGATGQVQVPVHQQQQTPQRAGGATSSPSWARASSPDTTPMAATPPQTPSKTFVPAMTEKIEHELEEYLKSGALELPSMESLGKDHSFYEVFKQHEAEFKNYYRRLLEQKGADAKCTTEWGEKLALEERKKIYTGPGAFGECEVSGGDPLIRTIGDQKMWNPTKLSDSSPLRKMPDIREEGDVDKENYEEDYQDEVFSRPFFVDEDFDDHTIVSGLTTVNSFETRRILQDCEQSVATFLKEEHDAIRKMIEEEEHESTESCVLTATSDIGSITKHAAEEAENMAKQMRAILDDFNTKLQEEEDDADSTAARKGGRRYKTSNPEEEWVSYYDEQYKRYYYHERNTNRTQWEPPDVDASSHSAASHEDSLSIEQVIPETAQGYGNRYAQYRRKQRRARKRRLAALAAFVLAGMAGGGGYYYWTHVLPLRNAASEPKEIVEDEKPAVERLACLIGFEDFLQSEAQRQLLLEEERLAREKALHRPWMCNIPLAYVVHPRCRRLASENPIFDLQAIISAMMQ